VKYDLSSQAEVDLQKRDLNRIKKKHECSSKQLKKNSCDLMCPFTQAKSDMHKNRIWTDSLNVS